MGGGDHRCEWRDRAEALEAEVVVLENTVAGLREENAALRSQATEMGGAIAQMQGTLAQLQRHVFGKRSEKMPPVADELRRAGAESDPAAALAKRQETAEKKKALPTREIVHRVAEEKKVCPKCGGHEFSPLGPGKATAVYEYVPGRFERQLHVQEKLRCRCGETILTAEGAPKVYEKAEYGPGFHAHVIVSKVADAIPHHRLEKQCRRSGVPIRRSTLGDLFHRAAEELEPLAKRLTELVAENEIVQADETTLRVQAKGKTRTAWLWTFLARNAEEKSLVSYHYSPSRSGETPAKVLGATQGKLVVDGYTGYNRVTLPGGRERAGCLAHVRRKFFDALQTTPAAQRALDLILEIYKVERAALDQDLLGSPDHLAMRAERSQPVMNELRSWLETEQPRHLPQGPMGQAIGYALNQWDALTRFLEDPRLPVDNNASERALRAAALGRKNWLFVGHDHAGENIAGLFSLVATCEANGVNPLDYLTDVLIRVQTHPAARIDELLPHHWKPPSPPPSS